LEDLNIGMSLGLETPPEKVEIPWPEITSLEGGKDDYGKFNIEPLERGYGMTLGNSLRRILLSSIQGTAVTWVKIENVLHEYSTIPHVKEDVTELLVNFKSIRLRSLSDRPGKMRLEVSGEGWVTAGDIKVSSDFEIINPELHLATLDSPEGKLSVEFNIEQGKGYSPASDAEGLPIGVLPVDSLFSPVLKVNYIVERARIGQITDYERLILEVWTDESSSPLEVIPQAAQILVDHFFIFANVGKTVESDTGKPSMASSVDAEVYNATVEGLGLSARSLNSLKRAHINKVGEILEQKRSELLKIRNFGSKSLEELYARLDELGFLPEEINIQDSGEDPETDTINDKDLESFEVSEEEEP
jgi:DNA-directed RNA polymerase subunit alpha